MRLIPILLMTALLAPTAPAQQKENTMPHHARGTFTVDMHPLTPSLAEGISRYSIDKKLTGDLEGSTKGEMLSGGDPKQGAAGYVAMELFTGTLAGKHGSFALQHMATMDQGGRKMSVIVVPGSGTQDLKGIAGTFSIEIANGQHSYDMEYTLP
jgi:hypothetical protein